MKKIIISVTNDLVSDQRVHKVANSLVNAGYDITLVGRRLSNSKIVSNRPYNVIRFNLVFPKGVAFYLEYNFRLLFHLIFTKYDIFLSNDLDSLSANFIASRIKNKTLVYDSHEYFTEVPELVNRKRKKKVWEFLEKKMLPKIKYSYTVCDSIAKIYKDKYGIDMKTVRNLPICIESYYDNKMTDISKDTVNTNKIILYQGAVNIGRGIDTVISSMKYLNNCEFWIIGNGDIFEEMKQHSKNENVENKVKFFGKIPFEELRNYTVKADLGISLEENMGLNYYFSLPNKIFDYIHAGIPLLVSPFPEMKNIIDHYKVGMIAENRDPEKLAVQIESMLNNETDRKEWNKNIKVAAKKLCWKNEEKILLKIFKSINGN